MSNENPVFTISSITDMKLLLCLIRKAIIGYQHVVDNNSDKIYVETIKPDLKRLEAMELSLIDRINRIQMNEQ